MKIAPAHPLPLLHVGNLLRHTCVARPHGIGFHPPKLFIIYNCRVRGAFATRAIPQTHSHNTNSQIKTKMAFIFKCRKRGTSATSHNTKSKIKTKMAEKEAIKAQSKFRSEFLQVLRSRRTAQVPLTVKLAKPVANPLHQNSPPSIEEQEIMQCCPKAKIDDIEGALKEENKVTERRVGFDNCRNRIATMILAASATFSRNICNAIQSRPQFKILEENLYLTIEEGEQGLLPLLILSLKEKHRQRKRPAVVFLHSTNKYKEYLRPLLETYASRGYVAISVDSRYHGERASSTTSYRDALISAWKAGETMPFIYDTVWDLIKLADYLTQREDIDPSRIGITGISLGGMHAWFAAAADTRYAVVAPVIGVQGFRWAIDNDKWQARVGSIKPVFEVARDDLGKSAIDKEVVEKVWDRIAPGLASQFDSPYSIPSIAPRPLLILNGAEDPRCPLAGLEVPQSKAHGAYGEFRCLDNFKLIAEPGVGHQLTPFQVKEVAAWFDRFLKP